MQAIRQFEERLHRDFAAGLVPSSVHLYAGQEACAVGICASLGTADYFHITHRAHGPAIARGADMIAMAKEIYLRAGGLCRGKGGSPHLHDARLKLIGANSGVGSGAALACGSALAIRHRRETAVAVALLGDGSCNQGIVSESFNLAAIWKLPVVFAFENNGYAEATATTYAIAGNDLAARGRAFDMPATRVDGRDYFAVHDAAHAAIERARTGGGPSVVEIDTPRFFGHYEGDAQKYRPPAEVETLRREGDCITLFRRRVLDERLLDSRVLDAIDTQVDDAVDEAFREAAAAPAPDPAELHADVYATGF
ncbi:MAG: thiamine pyrophosphate-dependent dehydrogenase E1 component subunit alpha [Gammaproteobacteria bacterium]|nr:thiamine pyrophosphate-dependent dehydrogenase E1 component subunit alpha [Gammaproteobacteria bacterium]